MEKKPPTQLSGSSTNNSTAGGTSPSSVAPSIIHSAAPSTSGSNAPSRPSLSNSISARNSNAGSFLTRLGSIAYVSESEKEDSQVRHSLLSSSISSLRRTRRGLKTLPDEEEEQLDEFSPEEDEIDTQENEINSSRSGVTSVAPSETESSAPSSSTSPQATNSPTINSPITNTPVARSIRNSRIGNNNNNNNNHNHNLPVWMTPQKSFFLYHFLIFFIQNRDDFLFFLKENQTLFFSQHGIRKLLKRLLGFSADWRAGLVSAIGSIPAAILLALASGTAPSVGVFTFIYASILATFFAGNSFNLVGPTAALAGILIGNAEKYGAQALPFSAFYVGLMCFIVFIFQLERYLLLLPSSVIEGFKLGTSIIIGLGQVNSGFGLINYPRHETVWGTFVENVIHIPQDTNYPALITFGLVFVTTYVLTVYVNDKIPWGGFISVFGIMFGLLSTCGYWFPYQTISTRFGPILFKFTDLPLHPGWFLLEFGFITDCMALTFMVILETMIATKISDGYMTKPSKMTKPRREIFSMALTNLLLGLVGGFPVSGSIGRIVGNIFNGAKSRLCCITCGLFIFLITFFTLPFFNFLPLPFVAGMTLVASVRSFDTTQIQNMWHFDQPNAIVSISTAALCIFLHPGIGIAFGMIVSLLLFSSRIGEVHSELVMIDEHGTKSKVTNEEELFGKSTAVSRRGSIEVPKAEYDEEMKIVVYRIAGQLTYVNGKSHYKRLKKYAREKTCNCVVVSLKFLYFLDFDGQSVLNKVVKELKKEDKVVFICSVNFSSVASLTQSEWFKEMFFNGEVCENEEEAIRKYKKRCVSHHADVTIFEVETI